MVHSASLKLERTACQGGQDGQAAFTGRVVGTSPTTSSTRAAQAQGRTPAGCGPSLLDRYSVRVEIRLSVGVFAPGDGLRQRHDLLAPTARLARGRRLAEDLDAVLDALGKTDAIDWTAGVLDSCSVRAVFGGRKPVRIQRIAAKPVRSGI